MSARPPLDHVQVIVTETEDNPVTRTADLQRELEPVRTELVKHRIGLAIIGLLVASPKVGGPAAGEVGKAVVSVSIDALGTAGSVAVAAITAAAGLIFALRNL